MPTIQKICGFLDSFAPTRLAEDWDNVGLLIGDRESAVKRVMTCLTVTPESVQEAIDQQVDLIVSHHPIPFRPIKRLTTDSVATKLVWQLAGAKIAVYSPHTGFDSASQGINQMLGSRIGLKGMKPLIPILKDPKGLGAGRFGTVSKATTLQKFITKLKTTFDLESLQVVGDLSSSVKKVGVACGSGGSFLEKANRQKCDTFVTGEATFHTCLEAKAIGISLVLLGHYHSERFAVEELASKISNKFADIKVWASEKESDPLSRI